MPRGRPKGSKTKDTGKYKLRTQRIRRKHGKNCFKDWGKLGGNPILLKHKGGK